jgi:hypothetical protein
MAGYTEINLNNFSEFADTTERRFADGADLVEDLADVMSLYKVQNIPAGTGDRRLLYESFDADTYARNKSEGADAAKASVIMGYYVTMTRKRIAAEIDITYEARNDGKNQEILRKVTSLATHVPQRMALDLTHRLTFCTATSYTDMDGDTVSTAMGDTYALAYATHTLTSAADTYTNVITGNPAFSSGALEVAMGLTNSEVLNNFGEQRIMNFNTVVTANDPATIREVRQLLNSTADPNSSNSGVTNTYKGLFKHIILPRLATTATGAYDSTKIKYWFYIAVGEWDANLGIWEPANLKKPAAGNNGEDLHNDNWTFGCRGGYGIGIVSGRGLMHSTGVGA